MKAQRALHCTANLQQSYLGVYRYFHRLPQQLLRQASCATAKSHGCNSPSISSRRALTTKTTVRTVSSLPYRQPTHKTSPPVGKPFYDPEKDPHGNGVNKHISHRLWNFLAKVPGYVKPVVEGNDPITVALHGYITTQRPAGQVLFVQLVDPTLRLALQLVVPSDKDASGDAAQPGEAQLGSHSDPYAEGKEINLQRLENVDSLRPHTPVTVTGNLIPRKNPAYRKVDNPEFSEAVSHFDPYVGNLHLIQHAELQVTHIQQHNTFPKELVAKADAAFGPNQRHLQLRTDAALRKRIRTRSWAMAQARKNLFQRGFDEVETPLLFKSTPEGAREFIVPTREKGMAYALPQSPQQYKQLLMASGISHYFQFAKCFRDEDLRADRQPEFTQLDLEVAFVDEYQIRCYIESLILESMWPPDVAVPPYRPANPLHPQNFDPETQKKIPVFTYQETMRRYGSDKPDLRLGAQFRDISRFVPPGLRGMLTSLKNPVIEMMKMPMYAASPEKSAAFVSSFFDAAENSAYVNNPDGMPGITVYDSSKPLNGLASFGHEAAEEIEKVFTPQPGDILIMQSRPNSPFTGGSTMLGNLRRDIFRAAIEQKVIQPPKGFAMFWLIDFPLFSPLEKGDVGQGSTAGICSTHHPFTAPKKGQDLSKLSTKPLSIIGDHYDLVINGVEVGGGSRRIHNATLQEHIFRDVLKMPPKRIEEFRHLLNALNVGCPPHTGFALGFDRLLAVMLDVPSVRDVIAFPKHADGEDKLVGSPVPITAEQLSTYHLKISDKTKAKAEPSISLKA